jgi:hypothetical protein
LYGCEAWVSLLEGRKQIEDSKIKVLRTIFKPKREEVTRRQKKLHNGELQA